MVATRGPVPKRTEERRRKNDEDGQLSADQIVLDGEVEIPELDEERTHPVALLWYRGLAISGQAKFYEPSDWATAVMLAEVMSRELNPQPVVVPGSDGEAGYVEMHYLPMKGATLSSLLKGFSSLLVTEGDRRRMRVEVERRNVQAELPDEVTDISSRRASHFQ